MKLALAVIVVARTGVYDRQNATNIIIVYYVRSFISFSTIPQFPRVFRSYSCSCVRSDGRLFVIQMFYFSYTIRYFWIWKKRLSLLRHRLVRQCSGFPSALVVFHVYFQNQFLFCWRYWGVRMLRTCRPNQITLIYNFNGECKLHTIASSGEFRRWFFWVHVRECVSVRMCERKEGGKTVKLS